MTVVLGKTSLVTRELAEITESSPTFIAPAITEFTPIYMLFPMHGIPRFSPLP